MMKDQCRIPRNICGNNIRKYRLAKGISQKQLAEKCKAKGLNLTNNSISQIEFGERKVPDYELYVIAHVLEVSVEDLLNLSEFEYPH